MPWAEPQVDAVLQCQAITGRLARVSAVGTAAPPSLMKRRRRAEASWRAAASTEAGAWGVDCGSLVWRSLMTVGLVYPFLGCTRLGHNSLWVSERADAKGGLGGLDGSVSHKAFWGSSGAPLIG